MRRLLAASLTIVGLSAAPLHAQCPDGTPPPCARAARSHPPSVAILFMEPRARNADDSLLAEGLTLEIIDQLGGITRLDVRSRFVSRHIAAANDPMADARAVGVDYVVDGVVEVDTARVLMRGSLTRTATGRVVRPIRVERPRSELARLQAAVAHDVAVAVVGELVPSEASRIRVRPLDPMAHDRMLRARALNGQYTEQAYRQAIRLLEDAVRRDSTSSELWTELAVSYGLVRDFEPAAVAAADLTRYDTAMARAFALDSTNGDAMMGVAATRFRHNDVGPEMEALARRGLVGNRSSWSALGGAMLLIGRGHGDEGIALLREAVARDSLSPVLWLGLGARLSNVRRYTEAAEAVERALALRPTQRDSAQLASYRRSALLERGECAAAADTARARGARTMLVFSLRCQGRAGEADSVIAAALADTTLDAGAKATFLALGGRPDSLFARYDRTYPDFLVITLLSAVFDPYRQHPAYLALRHRMGLDR